MAMNFNCLPAGETLADLARRDHLQGFDVAFCKHDSNDPDDCTITCPPEEAEFATIYARSDLGESLAIHDVDLTNGGADSLAQACRAVFAAILNASRPKCDVA